MSTSVRTEAWGRRRLVVLALAALGLAASLVGGEGAAQAQARPPSPPSPGLPPSTSGPPGSAGRPTGHPPPGLSSGREAVPPAGPAAGLPPGPPGLPSEAMRRELLSRLSTERAWKLVDGLKLDQGTSAKIFPVLSKYDELFFSLFAERRELGRQLRAEMSSPAPNDARIGALVDKVLALRNRRHTLESERFTELRKFLTPWQQGRLLTLLPQIEGGFLRRIRHAREPERPDHGEGHPHGPGDGMGPEDLY